MQGQFLASFHKSTIGAIDRGPNLLLLTASRYPVYLQTSAAMLPARHKVRRQSGMVCIHHSSRFKKPMSGSGKSDLFGPRPPSDGNYPGILACEYNNTSTPRQHELLINSSLSIAVFLQNCVSNLLGHHDRWNVRISAGAKWHY